MSGERNTRSKKKFIAGSSFNPIRDDVLPQQIGQSSNNDDLNDTITVHPNEEDLRTLGVNNGFQGSGDETVIERSVSVQANHAAPSFTVGGENAASSFGISNMAASSSALSNNATAAPSENMRSVAAQQIVSSLPGVSGVSTNISVASTQSTGAIPKQQPHRIVIDTAQYANVAGINEIDGRSLRNVQRENERHGVSIGLQHVNNWSINVNGLNKLWDDTMKVEFLAQSKHAVQIRCDLAKQYFDDYRVDLNEKFKKATSVDEAGRLATERDEVAELFLRVQTKMQERLAEINELERDNRISGSSNVSNQHGGMENDLKMDRMSIESFAGDFDKWPEVQGRVWELRAQIE